MLKFPSLPPNTPHQTTKNISIDRSDMPPPPPGVTGKRPRPPDAYLHRSSPDLDSSSRLTPVRARHSAVLVRDKDEQSIRQKRGITQHSSIRARTDHKLRPSMAVCGQTNTRPIARCVSAQLPD